MDPIILGLAKQFKIAPTTTAGRVQLAEALKSAGLDGYSPEQIQSLEVTPKAKAALLRLVTSAQTPSPGELRLWGQVKHAEHIHALKKGPSSRTNLTGAKYQTATGGPRASRKASGTDAAGPMHRNSTSFEQSLNGPGKNEINYLNIP